MCILGDSFKNKVSPEKKKKANADGVVGAAGTFGFGIKKKVEGRDEESNVPYMRASRVNGISGDDGLLSRQPKQRMVDRITLQRPQQQNRTLLVALELEEAEIIDFRFAGRRGHTVLPEDLGPILDFLIVFSVDAGAHVGGGEKLRGRPGFENRVCGEEMVGVVVCHEDCF